MKDSKSSDRNDVDGEFHDAPDDFPFFDCIETFPELIESNGDTSISSESPNSSYPADKDIPRPGIRRRRSHSNHKSPVADSSFNLENYLKERKSRLAQKIKDCSNEFGKSPAPLEIKRSSEHPEIAPSGENDEKSEEHSTITNANDNTEEDLARDESSSREIEDPNSSLLFTLAGIVVKSISFQIYMLVNIFMFPLRSVYYMYMFVLDPFGLMKRCREFLFYILKTISKGLYELLHEWFNEHQSVWKLGVKLGWGLLWSCYVCAVLVGLLLSAFVMGWMLIKSTVDEPIRMTRSLNFDFKEKSPVAFVPIMTGPELIHDMYLGEKPEIGMDSGSRVIPANHKLKVTVSLTLPESEYNRNLGIFQVRVDFLGIDGKSLARSRRPCMLQFKSQPIRLALTMLKVAPILTGYTSETQNLEINFRGFTEGKTPTAYLSVAIEQRAEFSPGGGIPEIYDASLTLESELPLLKKGLWFWKNTLFVWISMVIFSTELFFALLCCKPIVIPRIRLRVFGDGNRDATRNDRSG